MAKFLPAASTAPRTASQAPSAMSQARNSASSKRPGQPQARRMMSSTVRRTSSLPPNRVPAAATGGWPTRVARVSSSRSDANTSSGAAARTRVRAVEPSSNAVFTHKWAAIFNRWDLPEPKKPLTQAASCLDRPRLPR